MIRKNNILVLIIFSLMFSIDSDGDGYSDKDEIQIGTNPKDKSDRYYLGSWPYNPNKDKIKGAEFPISCPNNISCECTVNSDCINNNCERSPRGAFYCTPQPGDTFPQLIAVDQHGEFVDIDDFAMQGKDIVIEFGTSWCSPCQGLSYWLSTGDDSIIKNSRWWKDEYSIIYDKIINDDILFITIIFENELKDPATFQTVSDWHDKYPNDKIVILADEYKDIHQWIKPTGYPCINILDENMKLVTFTGRGLGEAFDILSNLK